MVQQDHGNSFAQKGNSGGNGNGGKHYDKKFWQDKTCHKCGKKGHPANACTNPRAEKDDDDKSRSSTSSRSSSSSKAKLKALQKDYKKTKKTFATLQTQIEELEEQSDLSNSEEESEATYLIFHPEAALKPSDREVDRSTGVLKESAKQFPQKRKKGSHSEEPLDLN